MSINLEKIKEYTGADDIFTFMLFDKFLGHLEADITDLEQELNNENWLAVKAKVHAMLSSARIFFLEDIIDLSEVIEKNCQNGNTDEVPAQVKELISKYREIESEIKSIKSGAV